MNKDKVSSITESAYDVYHNNLRWSFKTVYEFYNCSYITGIYKNELFLNYIYSHKYIYNI